MSYRKVFFTAGISLSALAFAGFGLSGCASMDAQADSMASTSMATDPDIEVVQDMITAWNVMDWDGVADLFTEDGVLHSMMIDPVVGREAIRPRIVGLGEGIESITLNIVNIGKINDVVVIERVDEFVYKGHYGKVPVVGILEIEGDKVKVWREYYDRAELLEAMGLEEDFG
jgi:limonene-1,2-epoxide hydrolase